MKNNALLERHSELFRQFVRYAITGGLASAVNIGVYWVLALRGMDPNLAWTIGYIAAVAVGYVVHSRWSFRGHGKREDRRMKIKFLAVQSSGFLLNEIFTWVLTGPMHGPVWWPLIPAIFVTPLATYAVNRQWVFG